jgi:hypothetical protein
MLIFGVYGLLKGGELPQITVANVLFCLLWAAAIWGLSSLEDIADFYQRDDDDDSDADTCRLCYDTEHQLQEVLWPLIMSSLITCYLVKCFCCHLIMM